MAEGSGSRRRRGGATEEQAAEDRKPTERVILKQARRALIVPEGVPEEAVRGARNVLRDAAKKLSRNLTDEDGAMVEAWFEVARTKGDKRKAIVAYAGEPNTPEAKPGVYKAPTASAMAGGRRYVKPPEPKVEAEDID